MSTETGAWMPMYWGDYFGDTMHLTTEEHGAYLLLIGTYWQRARPLPDDNKWLASASKMSTKKWIKVRPKIAEFFNVLDGEWTHKRITKETLRSSARLSSARAAGKAGGLAKGKLTTTTIEEQKEPPPIEAPPKEPANDKPTKPRAKRTQLPADWEITSADITYAQKKGYTILQIEHHGEHFSNYHWREKTTCFDWHRSFITWILHDINRHGPPRTRQPKHGGADEGAGGFAAAAISVAARMEGRGNGMGNSGEVLGDGNVGGQEPCHGVDRPDNDAIGAEGDRQGTDDAERADEAPEG